MNGVMPPKENAIQAIWDIKKLLDHMGVDFMLDGGTLLGAWRDRDFCDQDWDDIDLTVFNNKGSAVESKIIEKAGELGFVLYYYWPRSEKKTAQVCLMRDDVKVDIMFKEVKGDQAWWTVYQGRNVVYKAVPAHHYANVEWIFFYDQKFLVPNMTGNYLALRYGEWEKPVHRTQYSCYTSDKVIKESYEAI